MIHHYFPKWVRVVGARWCDEPPRPGDKIVQHRSPVKVSDGVYRCERCGKASDSSAEALA